MKKACEEPEKMLGTCAALIARDGQMRIGKYCNVWATFIFATVPHQVDWLRSIRKSCRRGFSPLAICTVALLLPVFQASAIIDATLQMQLGNPTEATTDPSNHVHYLIQRTVEAIDYSDTNGCPNWASWDLTASDYVVNGPRSSSFFADTSLPAGFHVVHPNDYTNTGYDRGHMCTSADRTDNTTDNDLVFLMSNIIPQNPNQNQGVWGDFEDYCRSLISTQELLITCGPRNFGTTTIVGGYVYVPSNTWKIAVCVPLGGGTALSRITNANPASIRVIAVDIANTNQSNPWTSFVTSAKQIQQFTGFTFFSALPNNLAWVLRSKVDGLTPTAPSIASFSPSSGSQSNSVTISGAILDTITNVSFNGTVASYTITATNQIVALVPVGASSGQITVRGLGGNATSVSTFTVAPPVIPDFTVTPADAFTSSGDQGGPFGPSSQTYTLNNTNATSLNWAVGKNASWLDLSVTSGTLPGGASTDITVSVNSAANSLLGGIYSDTVTFSNSTTGGWVPRPVNLTVLALGQLSISPVITFSATTQAGGPFSPSSQDYTLSNTGSVSLNWTASATASWLNLSTVSGTLAGGSSTVVTVSIDSSAITLPPGSYSDVIGFTNTTNHAGDGTRGIGLTVISFGFFDDFGTFTSGNLVGQANWQESGTTNVLWTFEGDNVNAYDNTVNSTTVGNIAADVGSGVATGVHASAASDWSAPSGNGSVHSWSVNNWSVGDYFQFQVSTLGVAGIQLSWDQNGSASGPRDFVLQYSTNGTSFTQIGSQYSLPSPVHTWSNASYDATCHFSTNLSSITALDNASSVYFRFVDNSTTRIDGGTVATAGTDRMDNFLVARAPVAPIQISGGKAWIPGGQTAIKPDAWKDFTLTTDVTVFAGLVVNVTNAPVLNSGTPSFFAALASANGGVGSNSVANYQLTAKAADAANTNYVIGGRTTSESGAPFVYGTTGLSYGTAYRLIVRTDPAGTNMTVYVNPTSNVLGDQTPYLTAIGGTGITPATILGSVLLTQNKNGSLPTAGAGIGKVCAASDYASVYDFLLGGAPPVAIFTGNPTTGAEPLNVSFADASTGTITNRFWEFGDRSTTNVTTNIVVHTYTAGTYDVMLVVTGQGGVSTNIQASYIVALTAFQAWQVQYFGDINNPLAAPGTDPDGDGMNNLQEFLAGTDPTNSASAMRITSITRQGTNVAVTWMTGVGKTNALQVTNGGLGGSYATNGFADLVIITNTIGTVTNGVDQGGATSSATRYYRVRLVP
jgi:DNA/RNA endonuclease G (NUC1)/PKD repeat protein